MPVFLYYVEDFSSLWHRSAKLIPAWAHHYCGAITCRRFFHGWSLQRFAIFSSFWRYGSSLYPSQASRHSDRIKNDELYTVAPLWCSLSLWWHCSSLYPNQVLRLCYGTFYIVLSTVLPRWGSIFWWRHCLCDGKFYVKRSTFVAQWGSLPRGGNFLTFCCSSCASLALKTASDVVMRDVLFWFASVAICGVSIPVYLI